MAKYLCQTIQELTSVAIIAKCLGNGLFQCFGQFFNFPERFLRGFLKRYRVVRIVVFIRNREVTGRAFEPVIADPQQQSAIIDQQDQDQCSVKRWPFRHHCSSVLSIRPTGARRMDYGTKEQRMAAQHNYNFLL